MNGFYCQLEAIRFQQLEALKCNTCQYFSQLSVQIQMSCHSNVCTILAWMTNYLLKIFMSIFVDRYCWLIKHRKYTYSDLFQIFRNFTIFKPSLRFPGCERRSGEWTLQNGQTHQSSTIDPLTSAGYMSYLEFSTKCNS